MFQKTRVIFVCLLITCLFVFPALTGCQGNAEKKAEDNAIETGNDKDAGTDVMTDVSSADWPSDIPGYVPQLSGDFSGTREVSDTEGFSRKYHILYENITDTMESYEEELVSRGWNIIVATDLPSIWSINASYDGGKAYLTVTVYKDESLDEEEGSGEFVLGIE